MKNRRVLSLSLSLVVVVELSLGAPKSQEPRLDRSDERSNRESETTKGEGEMSTLTPLFPTPHF